MRPSLFAGRTWIVMPDRVTRPHEARVRELMARCDDVLLVMIEVAKLADQLLEEVLANGPPGNTGDNGLDEVIWPRGFE